MFATRFLAKQESSKSIIQLLFVKQLIITKEVTKIFCTIQRRRKKPNILKCIESVVILKSIWTTSS